ncbi:MAG TPA: ABC transporter ATP-binding protein [Rhodospirillales bacterium]|nr:ABC transporter ATP-binding protein [Rhodospirillales bacterium]
MRKRQKALQEGLGAMRETRVLGKGQYFLGKFRGYDALMVNNSRLALFWGALPPLMSETVLIFVMLGVVVILLQNVENPAEAIASLGILGVAAFRLMPQVNRLLMGINGMNLARSAVQLLSDEIRIYGDWADRVKQTNPAVAVEFSNEIVFNNISFQYPDTDINVLKSINLTIKQGQSIGLVGVSGAGKSTLADILLGLMAPTEGTLSIDGKNIEIEQIQWRSLVGFVPQSIFISDAPIRNNIAFGLDDHEIDDEAVHQALSQARLDEFVATLPDGIATPLGEHGSRLSGGQRQRIGIARALYNNPQIIVLDEATSALDVATEHQITRVLRDLHGEKTLVLIAHRLSTLRHCDRLVFMDEGEIIDAGTFAELNDRNNKFSELLRLSNVIFDGENSVVQSK